MATVKEHYERLLSRHYSWMFGGFAEGLERQAALFAGLNIAPKGSGRAVDLGAGCGFSSIPPARAGFSVTAVDTDEALLGELSEHAEGLDIRVVTGDLLRFDEHVTGGVELILCMTDTLAHLASWEEVRQVLAKVYAALEDGGTFVCTFRDQSRELVGTDRFIPVRSDHDAIFTCFLEYFPETLMVHDLIHCREDGEWKLFKSCYPKLRLSEDRVQEELAKAGFTRIKSSAQHGFVTIQAGK